MADPRAPPPPPPSPGFLIKRKSRDSVKSQRNRSMLHKHPHSLPSALNDPRRGRQADLFTRDWGDGFVPTKPRITFPYPKKELHPHTKAQAALKRHRASASSLLASGTASPHRPGDQSDDSSQAEGPASSLSSSSLAQTRRRRLPNVPSMFLNAEFDLRDQETFDAVILGGCKRISDLRANTRLRQEKLSNHLDAVEMQLSVELAQRAERIFAAMSSHEELGTKVAAASRAVHQFRTRLDATKRHVRVAYINTLRLLIQRQNHRRALGVLDTIATVSKTQSTIQYLLAGGDYNRALNLIRTTQEVVATDLQGVHAVRHLAHQLNEIKSLIAKMVDGDLVQILTENIKTAVPPLDTGAASEGGEQAETAAGREAKAGGERQEQQPDGKEEKQHKEGRNERTGEARAQEEEGMEQEEEEEEEDDVDAVNAVLRNIRPLIGAVARQQQSEVLASYENNLITLLRGLVKDLVVDYLRRSPEKAVRRAMMDPTQIASWGDSLRLLSFDSWMLLLDRVTRVFLKLLRRIVHNQDALAFALRELAPTSPSAPSTGPPSPSKPESEHTLDARSGGSRSSSSSNSGSRKESPVQGNGPADAATEKKEEEEAHGGGDSNGVTAATAAGDDAGDGDGDVGKRKGEEKSRRGERVGARGGADRGGAIGDKAEEDAAGTEDDGVDDEEFVSDALANTMDASLVDLVDVDVDIAGDSTAASGRGSRSSRDARARARHRRGNSGSRSGFPGDSSRAARARHLRHLSTTSTEDTGAGAGAQGTAAGAGSSNGVREDAALTESQYERLVEINRRIVRRAVEEVHTRLSKLFQARCRDGTDSKVPPSSFILYYNKVWSFLSESDRVCGLHNTTLRNTLSTQARSFATRFHSREVEKLHAMLQTEAWAMADVPAECQRLYDRLLHPEQDQAGVGGPEQAGEDGEAAGTSEEGKTGASRARKRLDINGEDHAAIGALLLFIKMIAEYCKCLEAMPLVAADLLRKLFEVLRAFNAQVRRLILQAEAMRTLGLKRITAKHIALSAEAIAAVLAVLPSIKQRSAKLVRDKSKSILSEFNSVQDEYARHQHDLLEKLNVIMEDVWNACEQAMAWQKAVVTTGCKTFTTSAQKLHKALLPILPPATLQVVFANVMRMLNDKLKTA